MKTPKIYSELLGRGEITRQMLTDCLYSVNKRAKNARDKEREYRNRYRYNRFYYDKYDNEEKCREKKFAYYTQKEILLTLISPLCIHREFAGYERKRIYDYQKTYNKYKGKFVWENCYYEEGYEVWFGDIELRDKPRYRYYLFYDLNCGRTFHTPIDEENLSEYSLEIVDIDPLDTYGDDINDLLSCQFVKKVIEALQAGNLKLID